MEYRIETEQDLNGLLGQYESIRLEFKASALLSQQPERIIKQLTEAVSSFANTEGGTIIIGIKEGNSGKKSVATEIDEGVDPAIMPHERLEQLIASNISPPVPGLRVHPIPLTGSRQGRVAYIVTVPKGTTAYQARHSLLYYTRTGFSSVPLHDNVIRLLMNRGKVAHAVIELSALSSVTAEEEHAERQRRLAQPPEPEEWGIARHKNKEKIREQLQAPKRTYDEHIIEFAIRNDGPITIRDSCLTLVTDTADETQFFPNPDGKSWIFYLQPAFYERTVSSPDWPIKEAVPIRQLKLFPEQLMPFPNAKLTVKAPAGTAFKCIFRWTLYLEDAPSVSGDIDLGKEICARKGMPA